MKNAATKSFYILAICIIGILLPQEIIAQKNYILTGTIKGIPDVEIRLIEGTNIDIPNVISSSKIKDGKFNFKGETKELSLVSLIFQKEEGEIFFFIPLVLDEGETSLTADTANYIIDPSSDHPLVYPTLTTSSKIGNEYQSYINSKLAIMPTDNAKKLKSIVEEYDKKYAPKNKEPNDAWYDKYENTIALLSKDFNANQKKMIAQFANSLTGILILNNEQVDSFSVKEMNDFLENYKKDFENTAPFKTLNKKLNKFLNIAMGATAPNFTLKNKDGETVSLSDFKGKYVLIDFWTYWCGPCLAEFPHLEELLKKYKADGFEILGVHGDKDKAKWLSALKENKPSSSQVFDANAFDGESVSDLYNINAFPTGFLIDPTGKIVGRDLYAENLDAKLLEIFKK